MRICTCLVAVAALSLLPCLALADAPQVGSPEVSYGVPAGAPPVMPPRGDVCQYGFSDDTFSYGWSLFSGQQLGIKCSSPGAITSVGFYVEFGGPGALNVTIYDDNGLVSSTPTTAAPGINEVDVPDESITGDACIMLCPTSFNGVCGEDYSSAPYGNSYWSNGCACTNPFSDNNLWIWADTAEATATEPVSWGTVRSIYR